MAITTFEMLFVQTVAFTGLFHSIQGFQLPSLPLPSYGNQVVSGQLDSLDHLKCGLTYNIWGQVSPTLASGHANLCLQCRISTPGSTLNFAYVEALSASIIDALPWIEIDPASNILRHVPPPHQGDLTNIASRAETSETCESACSGDERCASCEFLESGCKMTAVDYLSQTHSGKPLAEAFERCFARGGSKYCGLCRTSCSGPRPSGLPRRSLNSSDASNIKCPSGLTACPISLTASFTPSTGFECLDIKQEITSCGGCATLNKGVDCSTIDGAALTGCSDGVCKICYTYSQSGKECLKISHLNLLK
ncbi:hypothetical protein MJO28_005464 [Puccinia striiformis f. sp. tritici]|uniref:Uncharacterized protein n=1 Tax=Puccinia striiformis f. sp. tritici TaxID=168172 RepID=A0ACC0EKS3_9BASI|nr:hypothetical protein MJO28_005464 [Puccinia striiformis f. sp. tritici]